MLKNINVLIIKLEFVENILHKSVTKAGEDPIESEVVFPLAEIQAQWQALARQLQQRRSRHMLPTAGQASAAGDDYRQNARALGQQLFEAIFRDRKSYAVFENAIPEQHTEQPLLLQFRLNQPALQALPWELLHHEEHSFLALDSRFSLLRYIEQGTSKAAMATSQLVRPVRVLFVAANPQGSTKLELEQEYHKLRNELREAEIDGIIEVEPLFHATLETLQEKLAKSEYHVLHFAGHASQEGYLLFENATGHAQAISAENIATQLNNHHSLALVLLNACESGTASHQNQPQSQPQSQLALENISPFAGIAQKLAQRNIPAVLAMQLAISDPSAIRFSGSFYQSLGQHGDVARALTEARVAIDASSSEWLTPVLYSRADDLRLLSMRALNDDEKAARIERLREKLLMASQARDWQEADILARKVAVLHEDEAPSWLDTLQQDIADHLALPEKLQKLEQLLSAGESDAAYRLASQLKKLEPTHPIIQKHFQNLHAQRYNENKTPELDSSLTIQTVMQGILESFADDSLVFVLGSELYHSYGTDDWLQDRSARPPSARELGRYLSVEGKLVRQNLPSDLNHIIQRISLRHDALWLEEKFQAAFSHDHYSNNLYALLAALNRSYNAYQPLILCYALDDLLIQFFARQQRPFDVLRPQWHNQSYKFVHKRFDGQAWLEDILIREPQKYLFERRQPVIIKVNGYIDDDMEESGALLSEDDYLAALSQDLMEQLPISILKKLRRRSRFLFLGTQLDRWYTREVFRSIRQGRPPKKQPQSWAVHPSPDPFNNDLWQDYRVEVLPVDLNYFTNALQAKLEEVQHD